MMFLLGNGQFAGDEGIEGTIALNSKVVSSSPLFGLLPPGKQLSWDHLFQNHVFLLQVRRNPLSNVFNVGSITVLSFHRTSHNL